MADFEQYYIVTYFGNFVGRSKDTGDLIQFKYNGLGSIAKNNALILSISDSSAVEIISGCNEDQGKTFSAEVVGDFLRGTISLKVATGYLGASADEKVLQDRTEVGLWEKFKIISVKELNDLEKISSCKWVAKTSGNFHEECKLCFKREFNIGLGELSLSIVKPIRVIEDPESFDGIPHEFVATYDDWKIERFLRYRPLVYLVAYGAERIFKMLEISLLSLAKFGKYDGDVIVITDKHRDDVASYIPPDFEGRWHIMHEPASDFIDFCKSRYQISRWHRANSYQPILYVDTDVIFDSPLDPILIKLLRAGKFAAQKEGTRPLASSDSVGASLLAEDKCVVGDKRGFNSGIICIPNTRNFGEVMLSISDCIDSYSTARGRQALGWFDQAIANYVTYKLCEVDIDILDMHTRWGGRDALHGGIFPRGFVHLWGGNDKISQMQELISSMSSPNESGVRNWIYY